MSDPNFFEQALNLAESAGVDTSSLIDGVADKLPGGDLAAGLIKSQLGIDNNQGDDSEDGETASDSSEQDA